MKKLMLPLIIGLLVISTILFAQTNRNTGVKSEYCEFTWTIKFLLNGSKSFTGVINFSNGSSEEFNKSCLGGLNYLGANGWELHTTNVVEGDAWRTFYYVFQRNQ